MRWLTRSCLVFLLVLVQNVDVRPDPVASAPDPGVVPNNGSDPLGNNGSGHHDDGNHSDHGGGDHGNKTHHSAHGIHVVSWHFDYVRQPLIISLFMIVAALTKLGFHHVPSLSTIIPESCVLIILGVIVGGILQVVNADFQRQLSPTVFFLYLLPPIILESSYSLHDRVFLDNIGTILVYAVIGTLLNCFLIGLTLYGLSECGALGSPTITPAITLVQCLVFSALIVAVDPVAVLAIFQEIGVNNVLYFLVFGESLLNDAVTVVLYNMMKTFNEMDDIPPSEVGLGVAAFFTVSLGGLSIGFIFGGISSFLTKFTMKVQVVEPLTLFTFAYSSYLVAELFHLSGIISIIGCGLVQAQYAFHNISHKSYVTVTYFSKMLSATCDCIIFMFLGLAVVRRDHDFHAGFILWSIFLCLAYRFCSVFFLTFIVNKLDRVKAIDLEEQFIMAYGGLRGAVAFCLVAMLNEETLPQQNMFETTTLCVIFFTVFVQGISIKPLVNLLRITRTEDLPVCIYEEINYRVTDHVMAGVEEIIGRVGYNVFLEHFMRFDVKYMKPLLQRDPQGRDASIMQLYEKISLYRPGSLDPHHLDPVMLQRSLEMGGHTPRFSALLTPGTAGSVFFPSSPFPPPPSRESHSPARSYGRRQTLATTGVSDADAFLLSPTPVAKQPRTSWFPWRRGSADPATKDEEAAQDRQTTPLSPGGTSVRFRNAVLTVMRNDSDAEAARGEEPSVGDVRRWLVANPSRQNYHRKYDKNLTRSNDRDLLHHLQEKQRRLRRYRMSVTSLSPEGSPWASTENVQGPRQSTLDVIRESSLDDAAQDMATRPQSYPAATGLEKRNKLKQKNPKLQKAYTVDSADEKAGPKKPQLSKASSFDATTPAPSTSTDPFQDVSDTAPLSHAESAPLETISEETGSMKRRETSPGGSSQSVSPQHGEGGSTPSSAAGSDSDSSVSMRNRGKLNRQLATAGKSGDSVQEDKTQDTRC